MSGQLSTAITLTSSAYAISDPAEITAIGLSAGSDAATAEFRDGGPGGPLRWKLSAVATDYNGESFDPDLRFENNVYIAITGTSPVVSIAFRRPKSA